jgi:N-acetylglucosamine-6-phosphate deacetylase
MDFEWSAYTSSAASSSASSAPTSLSNSPIADMGPEFICLSNVQVLESDASISQRPLYIDQSTGCFVDENDISANAAVQVLDMQNKLVAPGLIDVQVNGALGFDFSIFDPSHAGVIEYEAGIRKVAQAMLKHGVTR